LSFHVADNATRLGVTHTVVSNEGRYAYLSRHDAGGPAGSRAPAAPVRAPALPAYATRCISRWRCVPATAHRGAPRLPQWASRA
jgi:hypothetical protein